MQRIGKVEENIRRSQPGAQFAPRNPDALQRIKIVVVSPCFLVEKAVTSGEAVGAELPLENCTQAASRAARSFVAGKSSSQIASRFIRRKPNIHCNDTENCLAFAILRRKFTPKKHRHAGQEEGKPSTVQRAPALASLSHPRVHSPAGSARDSRPAIGDPPNALSHFASRFVLRPLKPVLVRLRCVVCTGFLSSVVPPIHPPALACLSEGAPST